MCIRDRGVSVSEDFYTEEIKVARLSLSKKAEFLTKYCNIKQNSSVAWLDFEDVDGVSGKRYTLEDFRGCYCVAGIDLSKTTDLTAASIVIEKRGKMYIFTQFFMSKDRFDKACTEDNVPYSIYEKQGYLTLSGEHFVDYKDVYNWFAMLVKNYRIKPLKVGYDRYSAQYLSLIHISEPTRH